MRVGSLGGEDPLEEGMAIHSSILGPGESYGHWTWRASVHRIAKSWTRLKQLSSSSSPFGHLQVQISRSVLSDSLRPHELQHSRLPCPSLTPAVCSNSCPSSQWCHPTISSSVVPFSPCLQSLPASGFFPVSQFFKPGSQRIRTSASASVFTMNIQDWFPLGLTGLISLQSKGLSRVFSNTTVQKHQLFSTQLSLTSIHDYWKNHSFD